MAMPWKLAKAKAAAIRADTTGEKLAALNRLFNECFRIQREASFAAGRHIPLVVENVRGAQPWVGRARWNFGSFYLWGDVPALMPQTLKAQKVPGFRFDGSGKSFQSASVEHSGAKNTGGSWFNIGSPGQKVVGKNPVHELGKREIEDRKGNGGSWFGDYETMKEGVKQGGDWFNQSQPSISRLYSSKSPQRKMASAMIAMIPLTLSRHIGAAYRP